MDTSAVDLPALLAGIIAAGTITAAVAWGARREGRARLWITAGVVTVVLMAIGFADLMRERPRETHAATWFVGIPLPMLGALGLQHAMRRVRPWIRWSVVFATAFVLLLVGVLLGGAVLPRFLGA